MRGKLFLIPSGIGTNPLESQLPVTNFSVINSIRNYIVENERTARRFLIQCGIKTKIDDLEFYVLNKKTPIEQFADFLVPAVKGEDIGLISEAGCPGIADPGAQIVSLAHSNNIPVVPLTGPSSIVLALMGSGLNGQNFAFVGYLPIDKIKRGQKIRELENRCQQFNQTQICIETPYRNNQLFAAFLQNCKSSTSLSIACNLFSKGQYIKTNSISKWKKETIDFNKKPAVFLLLAAT
jgi:16S rRNA (cytidine1402-2'-O)-methyltransferase